MPDAGIHVEHVLGLKYHKVHKCVVLLLLSTSSIEVNLVICITMTTIQTIENNIPFG